MSPHADAPTPPDPGAGAAARSGAQAEAGSQADTTPDPRRRRAGGRGSALGLSAVGAALVAIAALPPWVHGRIDDPVLGHRAAEATGQVVAAAILACALVGLAAVVVAAVTGRIGRVVAGILTILAGLGAAWSAFAVVRDPASALARSASGSVGRAGIATVSDVGLTGWPWAALAGGLVAVLGGLLIVTGAGRWAGGSARYESPARAVPGESADATDAADALGSDAPLDPAQADRQGRAARRRAVEDWDSLSRGDDPTD